MTTRDTFAKTPRPRAASGCRTHPNASSTTRPVSSRAGVPRLFRGPRPGVGRTAPPPKHLTLPGQARLNPGCAWQWVRSLVCWLWLPQLGPKSCLTT